MKKHSGHILRFAAQPPLVCNVPQVIKRLFKSNDDDVIKDILEIAGPSCVLEVIERLFRSKDEDAIQSILMAVGAVCPVEEMVKLAEDHTRLPLLQLWLEKLRANESTDHRVYQALLKINESSEAQKHKVSLFFARSTRHACCFRV